MGDVVLGQLLRQGTRSVAIYFSDLLLWLSVASFLEVAFVLVAGVLCIMTAGFLFEGMKKNPVVLVLGAAVALGGTFLMFREVRGLIWPPDRGYAAGEPQGSTGALPTGTWPCSQLSKLMCEIASSCSWSSALSKCADKPPTFPLGDAPTQASSPAFSLCGSYARPTCEQHFACYWSVVTNGCEELRFGKGLLSRTDGPYFTSPFGSPVGPNCRGRLSQAMCLATAGCRWSFGICLPALTTKPSEP